MPWKCDYCTFINYRDSFLSCEICGIKKSSSTTTHKATQDVPRLDIGASVKETEDEDEDEECSFKIAPSSPEMKLNPQTSREPTTSQSKAIAAQVKDKCDERLELLVEILQSERTYVDSLCILVTHFLQPLESACKEGKGILSEKKLQGIFSNVQQIMSVNVELLRVMEAEAKLPASKALSALSVESREDLSRGITKAFKEVIPYFKMYSWYVNNYGNAVELLKAEQSSNKQFAKFLAEQRAHPICKGLDLGAYLIMPVQRLCKYPLLFDRLLKATPQENDDYDDISQVAQVVNGITSLVDLDRDRAEKSLRGFEIANFVSLESLTKRLGEPLHLLSPGRVFLFEWSGMISRSVNKRSVSEQKPRTMFLFSNVLLVAKKGSKGYDARVWMDLDKVYLGDLPPSPAATSEQDQQQQQGPASQPTQRSSGKGWKISGLIPSVSISTSATSSSNACSPNGAESKASKKKPSSPSSAGNSIHISSFAPLGGAQYQFSMLFESSSVNSSRLNLTRSRSKSKVSETFTFFFADESTRRHVHEQLRQAISFGEEVSPNAASPSLVASSSRPNSSHGRRPLSTKIDSIAAVPPDCQIRKTRSLSPMTSKKQSGVDDDDESDNTYIDSHQQTEPENPFAQPSTKKLLVSNRAFSDTASVSSTSSTSSPVPSYGTPPRERPPAPNKPIGGGKTMAGKPRPPAPGLSQLARSISSASSDSSSSRYSHGKKARPKAPTKAPSAWTSSSSDDPPSSNSSPLPWNQPSTSSSSAPTSACVSLTYSPLSQVTSVGAAGDSPIKLAASRPVSSVSKPVIVQRQPSSSSPPTSSNSST